VKRVVLDASVGVKWFRHEPGSAEALDLLLSHGRGEVGLVVPSLFAYEVMSVAVRSIPSAECEELWRRFLGWRISVVDVGDRLMRDALSVRERLSCSLYDALAPALAEELDARLCSADRRAHEAWPDVMLVG
jgi:predicted nucleic acid-binding protein